MRRFTQVKDVSWAKDDLHIRWYYDGTLNACYNCVDRHLESKGDDVAIIWESDDPSRDLKVTYRELHERVCRFANVLKSLGAKKGDRVTIYLPMIPEAAVAMLACARIGAVHSVVFGGFSPDVARRPDRRLRLEPRHHRRPGRARREGIPLKANVDEARAAPQVTTLEKSSSCATPGATSTESRAVTLAARSRGRSRRGLSLRGNERGGPAVHPLHLGFDGQA